MGRRFYISNEFKFIQGVGNLTATPSSATHMKYSDAKQFIINHPDHVMVRISGKKNNKMYIVSTSQKFIGDDNKIVDSIDKAMSFATPAAAYEYFDNNKDVVGLLNNPTVISGEYKKVKREASTPQVERLTKDNTGRISFTHNTKDVVAKNSLHICAICGKPIHSHHDDFSVDHIVPLSRGGTNDINNLRATHKICNYLKNNMTDDEMYDKIGDIACYSVFNKPDSDMGMRVIRSMVRGILNKSDFKFN